MAWLMPVWGTTGGVDLQRGVDVLPVAAEKIVTNIDVTVSLYDTL